MSKLFCVLVIYAGVCFSTIVTAGADSSGGGSSLGDRINPWFLENKSTISYCVDVNAQSFTQDHATLRGTIERAYGYWVDQIALAQRTVYSLRLATQTLAYQEVCTPEVDLRFAFGSLTDEVRAALEDSQEFIGIAVRTFYDPKTLSGRGFIYVSPDHGATRFRVSSPLDRAWEVDGGANLYWLLVHEIGHTLGLQHFGSTTNIMGANFPEWLVSVKARGEVMSSRQDTLVFDHTVPRIRCGYRDYDLRDGLDYLKIQGDCIKLDMSPSLSFELSQGESETGPWRPIGRFVVVSQSTSGEAAGAVMLFLKGPNWWLDLGEKQSTWETILSVTRQGASGEFRFNDGSPAKALQVNVQPNLLELQGIRNERFLSHLLHLSWH